MVEYLLATTLMVVAQNGTMVSEGINMTYDTQYQCQQALATRMSVLQRVYGSAPMPVGTELCVPRERKKVRPEVQKIGDDMRRAAERAAGFSK